MKMITVLDAAGQVHTYKHTDLILQIVGEYLTVSLRYSESPRSPYVLKELGVFYRPIRVHVEYPNDPSMFELKIK